jgi:hypothetical protein
VVFPPSHDVKTLAASLGALQARKQRRMEMEEAKKEEDKVHNLPRFIKS